MEQQELKPQNDTTAIFWKREITFGQFAAIIVSILSTFGIALWNQSKTITEQGVRLNTIEKTLGEIPGVLKEITREQKESNEKTQAKTELILIKLENKKDR